MSVKALLTPVSPGALPRPRPVACDQVPGARGRGQGTARGGTRRTALPAPNSSGVKALRNTSDAKAASRQAVLAFRKSPIQVRIRLPPAESHRQTRFGRSDLEFRGG